MQETKDMNETKVKDKIADKIDDEDGKRTDDKPNVNEVEPNEVENNVGGFDLELEKMAEKVGMNTTDDHNPIPIPILNENPTVTVKPGRKILREATTFAKRIEPNDDKFVGAKVGDDDSSFLFLFPVPRLKLILVQSHVPPPVMFD